MRRLAWGLGGLLGAVGLASLALVLWARPLATGPPAFTVEHQIDIEASADEVWAVFSDFDNLASWNPYLLALRGDPTPGATIEIVILQDNWSEPMTLPEEVIAYEEGRLFHWHGSILATGFLETDHSFAIEPLAHGRVRFIHREEFRGVFAPLMETDVRLHTQRAFKAMGEALAGRVAARRGNPAG